MIESVRASDGSQANVAALDLASDTHSHRIASPRGWFIRSQTTRGV